LREFNAVYGNGKKPLSKTIVNQNIKTNQLIQRFFKSEFLKAEEKCFLTDTMDDVKSFVRYLSN